VTFSFPKARLPGTLMFVFTALIASAPVLASSVTLKTVMGDVVIELYEEETPETVANFLNYVQDGDFNNSFIHRSDPDFIIQGGAYTFAEEVVTPIPTDPPVINEPGISNLRGTIAMAKRPGDPNSGTSQWFINLANNSELLDDQNGGFTVFGEVTGNGMDVVDAIAALPVLNAGTPCLGCSPLTELPLRDYPGGGAPIVEENLVMMDVVENSEFEINQGLNDTWYNIATNGQGFFIITYPELKTMFLTWFTYDTVRPDESVPFMLGEPGHRWMTAYGNYEGNRAELAITMTTGGIFDSGEPVPENSPDGIMIVEFEDCATGTVRYDITSISSQGEVPIQRVTPDNVALCEVLAAPDEQ
jgi:cyclophilin family peptidyl-prolyl cis-trans isomerase